MTALIVPAILLLVVACLWAWDRSYRAGESATHGGDPTLGLRIPSTPDARSAAPRFKGTRTGLSRATASPRYSPASASPLPSRRFAGSIRRDPDAIGVACGRPISQCTRGKDCLCID